MKAYRLAGWTKGGRFVDAAKPEPGPGEVLIKMGGVGVCHSDLYIVTNR